MLSIDLSNEILYLVSLPIDFLASSLSLINLLEGVVSDPTIEYKPYRFSSYHIQELKSLSRERESMIHHIYQSWYGGEYVKKQIA